LQYVLDLDNGPFMPEFDKNTPLKAQVEQSSAENSTLLVEGFLRSKTEALMALEYDRIPNVLKTPRAIALQRKVATTVMIVVPLILLAVAILGGLNAYRDHQNTAELRRLDAKLDADFEPKSSHH
jgi:hypothetical protein